mmetsp:Transcript_7980/g.11855  ORF Transcript_7980/g.11855 Transcript_7980/m.11855 type:complete len:127 (-) Transcript_7980:333-713(-)
MGMGEHNEPVGFSTQRGHCYKLFIHMRRCTATKSVVTACKPIVEDYFECVHRQKEVSYIRNVEMALEKRRGVFMEYNRIGTPNYSQIKEELKLRDFRLKNVSVTQNETIQRKKLPIDHGEEENDEL